MDFEETMLIVSGFESALPMSIASAQETHHKASPPVTGRIITH